MGRGWLGTQDSSKPFPPSFPPSPVLQGHGEERDNMTLSESGKVNRVECFVTCSSRPGQEQPSPALGTEGESDTRGDQSPLTSQGFVN